MKTELDELLDKHHAWMRDKTILADVGDNWLEITTPYVDRHNDMLQIYVRTDEDGFLITDDGATISDLAMSGMTLDTEKRRKILTATLNGFGVENRNDRLEVRASRENFPLKKHSLIQAMLAVNDMFFMSSAHVNSLFFEDVKKWLDESDVRYLPNTFVQGKSGHTHRFDFVIPKWRSEPERFVQAVNRPTYESAAAFAFNWIDTKDLRHASSKAYAVLNDFDGKVAKKAIDALKNYDINPVLWSDRARFVQSLKA